MSDISTKDPSFVLRRADASDAGLVLDFMRKLGAHQKMADEITASEASLGLLLANKQGEAVFGYYKSAPVGMVFFNQTSSAFTGRSGLFIDGFFIDEAVRNLGFGKVMMAFMSQEALARGCQMLEWGCLDWNKPTIDFYQGLGAYCLDTMRIYRLSPEILQINGARF